MMRFFILLLVSFLMTQCRKKTVLPVNQEPLPVQRDCVPVHQFDNSIVPANALTALMETYVNKGLPGISLMARKGNTYWEQQKGMADKETNKTMKSCMVWPGYSITKMYTATVILRLLEEGRINLDQRIATCLPANITAKVPGADRITIRMLLNHSSGIENFWDNNAYVLGYLDNPARPYTVSDYLNASQERLFEPGTDAAYSNTNYLLLALIIDYVTAAQHQQAFEKYIFKPLGLSGTYYKLLPGIQSTNTPKLYADMDGEGQLTDFTTNSYIQFANEYGSNGMLATPKNYVDFLHALTHGKILKANTFTDMKAWFTGTVTGEVYGLGLEKYDFEGNEIYGYSGSSFGGRTLLLYFPEKDLSLFVGVNAGAELGGPVLIYFAQFVGEMGRLLTR